MSFSGHKAYGPKGVGALYVRRSPRVRLKAMIHGGGHERGMRSGTLATHQIVGMGKAFEIAGKTMQAEQARLRGDKTVPSNEEIIKTLREAKKPVQDTNDNVQTAEEQPVRKEQQLPMYG